MARTAISVNVEPEKKDAWAEAAAAEGLSLSAWLAKLADAAVVRAAAREYRQVLADNPAFAAEIAAGRARMRTFTDRVRADRAAAFDGTAA
jgi:hypothetical protein